MVLPRNCLFLVMSHQHLREDKTCLNCGSTVEQRFCGNCGQENVETRQSFWGLLKHFIEDFTHYEGKFWQTLKLLFFKPALLTTEYLNGKRTSYVPPVRLYIFISFVTFFLPHVVPSSNEVNHHEYTPEQINLIDSIRNDSFDDMEYHSDLGLILSSSYKSLHELDSAQQAHAGTDEEKDFLEYKLAAKSIQLKRYMPNELWDLFLQALGKNFPKSLFIYLPLFALVLYAFHRKKHLYFDHAIFTLHYFSFLLLAFSCTMLMINGLLWADHFFHFSWTYTVLMYMLLGLFIWYVVYFFVAHYKQYPQNAAISILKGLGIFTLNLMLFFAVFTILLVFTLLSLH